MIHNWFDGKIKYMLSIDFNHQKITDHIFHILLPVLAVLLPLLFLSVDLTIMPIITTTEERLFTIFGFCMWCVLAIVTYREIKFYPRISFEKGLVILLPILVSFFYLVLIVEYAEKSWDYENYENAFHAVILHKDPYKSGHYLYPPLLAQIMAYVYILGGKLVDFTGVGSSLFVFYIYQCAQYFLVNLSFQLASRFASNVGLSDLHGKLIVAGLFLFNFPLIRTLHLNQINLVILLTTLIALLALNKFPALSGTAVMLGGLTKLYPLILGIPLLLMKKWRALLGSFFSGLIFLFLLTNFGQDTMLWRQFFQFIITFPAERESSIWIRNTSILSLGRNLSRFGGLLETAIIPLYIIGALSLVIWIFLRLYQREKKHKVLQSGLASESYRDFGNLVDFISLSLLITPSAWDHHFILALPLTLWAIALRKKDRPGWVGVATACIFVIPPFDIFPFSYLRMFGVVALLILTPPNVHLDLNGGNGDTTALV